MKKYQVQILTVDGSFKEEPKNFQLEDNATIEDLKKAFSKEDHVYHPDQLRLSYKTASGQLCKHETFLKFLTIFKISKLQPLRMMTIWKTFLQNTKENLFFNVHL